MAAARVDELCELSTSEDARSWLLTAASAARRGRPGEPWTIGLATRLLIVDGQLDAAEAFLGLFQKQCASEECRAYSDRLATELIAARTVSLDRRPRRMTLRPENSQQIGQVAKCYFQRA